MAAIRTNVVGTQQLWERKETRKNKDQEKIGEKDDGTNEDEEEDRECVCHGGVTKQYWYPPRGGGDTVAITLKLEDERECALPPAVINVTDSEDIR